MERTRLPNSGLYPLGYEIPEKKIESPADRIIEKCGMIQNLLLQKNAKYGNSALNPSRIFSHADPVEQLKVRIDDKLSRIRTTGTESEDEDTVVDLIGYLVLLLIARDGK